MYIEVTQHNSEIKPIDFSASRLSCFALNTSFVLYLSILPENIYLAHSGLFGGQEAFQDITCSCLGFRYAVGVDIHCGGRLTVPQHSRYGADIRPATDQ